ncbi:Hypoxanthine-guanine phosphoribosyltransferase [hydrothermal vent metagenome]|uniref:Hypoxanthine-guanine phosphoribosyltransferase n=1 Tax=hydrothermal vent metagenome TaxID=652676 RepID=A0A3B0XNT9_9ZZZZ
MTAEDTHLAEAQQVLEKADLIYSASQIEQAIALLAENINRQLGSTSRPVIVIPIMNGGLILGGQLITRLKFPLLVDYLHATRYRDETTGAELQWLAKPQQVLKNRVILIIDDILDEGYTLSEVLNYCTQQGAKQVYSAVLIEKDHLRPKAAVKTDFTGMHVEDRYVFGFGMDYRGYHRNLNGIYAVGNNEERG